VIRQVMRSPSRSAPLRHRQPLRPQAGETETIIGNWIATGGGRRGRTFVATKVYGEMGAEPCSWLSGLAAYPARGQRTDHRSANS
jgi:aryl-alcohol dehydrogenase-like predicted oxidoreductase